MNKAIFASLAAVLTGLVGSPISAEARHNDEAAAAIGGFIGGVIVGSIINDNAPPPAVIVDRGRPHYGPPAVVVSHGHSHRHGHWEWTTVRIWVPGRWAYVDRGHGRPHRVWVDGYYDRRRERVWVDNRGRHHRDCH